MRSSEEREAMEHIARWTGSTIMNMARNPRNSAQLQSRD